MSATIIYLPEAKTDVLIAHSSYEQRQAGLGDRFLAQLDHRLDVISANPELYAVLQDEVRAAPLNKFPYVVYYRIETEANYILAVLHGHQDPRHWMLRG